MKPNLWLLAALPLIGLTAQVAAVPGGEIGTLEQGRYSCELPGDAAGPAGIHQPAEDFTVISASSYRANGTLGSYLLTGDSVVMTNGPHRGERFQRQSRGFLRQINADGSEGLLRCVLGRKRKSEAPPCPQAPAEDGPSLQVPQASTGSAKRQARCETDRADRG